MIEVRPVHWLYCTRHDMEERGGGLDWIAPSADCLHIIRRGNQDNLGASCYERMMAWLGCLRVALVPPVSWIDR